MDNGVTYQDENAIITEVINGQEVLMSPRPALTHSAVAGNIHRIFSTFLRGKRCKTFFEPDVFLDEKIDYYHPILYTVIIISLLGLISSAVSISNKKKRRKEKLKQLISEE